MKKIPAVVLIWLLVSGPSVLKSQDIHFSQFRNTPLLQNPALAGSTDKLRVILNYRDQWKTVGTPYKTVNAAADMILTRDVRKSGYFAMGIDVFSDRAGESELQHVQTSLSLAYHTRISDRSTLGAGINTGYAQRSINYSNLRWGSQYNGYQYDAALPPGLTGSERTDFLDMGAGLVWNYAKGEKYMTGNDQRKATIGLSVFHLNRPEYSFHATSDPLAIKTVVYGDMLFGVPNTNLALMPGFFFYQQGTLHELTAGLSFRYVLEQQSNYTGFQKGKALALGIYHRSKDAFIATMDLELGTYEIGFSYDITGSSLTDANNGRGGMEVSLRSNFQNPLRKGRVRS